MKTKQTSVVEYVVFTLIALLLLTDVGYSTYEHYSMPLDGDMVESIIPEEDIIKVFEDPLGIQAVTEKEYRHNPNRFFSHWTLNKWFRTVPFVFQKVTNPINSVYATSALAKILMQVALIVLIAMAILGTIRIFTKGFLLVALLITPLFQTNGYVRLMGIIDPAVSYDFFYALPAIFVIIYFMPLIFECFHGRKVRMPLLVKLLWILLAFVICFGGPLNPGIVLIVAMMLVVPALWRNYFRENQGNFFKRIGRSIALLPKNYYVYLLPIGILSLYSLYVGTYNSAKFWDQMPLLELYSRLPIGLFDILTEKPCYAFMALILAVNIFLIIKYHKTPEGDKVLKAFKWVAVFSLIYILLLPLGGYRMYRPNIIRYDTFMPVTLCLIFLFALSSFFVLKNMVRVRSKIIYYPVLLAVLTIYTLSDHMNVYTNLCEKVSLQIIVDTPEQPVRLTNNCSIVSWKEAITPQDSKRSAELIHFWRITDTEKLFYNKP